MTDQTEAPERRYTRDELQAAVAAVPIKPLVWKDARFRASPRETADTIIGTYEVLQWTQGDFGGSVPADDPDQSNTEFGDAASMEEAKATAQAHYNRRIRDALDITPEQFAALDRVKAEARREGMVKVAARLRIHAETYDGCGDKTAAKYWYHAADIADSMAIRVKAEREKRC